MRWSANDASFPGSESDYGSHVAIVNWVATKPSWPPIYLGMLGAHSLAALLHLVGLSIPRAMLVVADLSALLLIVALARIVWPLGKPATAAALATVMLISAPVFSTMQRDGYFAALVSLGLYASGAAVLVRAPDKPPLRKLAAGGAWFVAGAFTYPDGVMWCLPLLLAASYRSLERAWWLAAAALSAGVEFALLRKQFDIATRPGGGLFQWTGVVIVVLPWCALFLATRSENLGARRLRVFVSTWMAVAFLLGANSLLLTGELHYYSRKPLYSLIYVAPLIAACIAAQSWLGRACVLGGLISLTSWLPTTLRESFESAYVRLAHPRSHFDGSDEDCVEAVQAQARRRACKHLLVLPGSKAGTQGESWGQRILRVMAANSYTREYDPHYTTLRAFKGPFSDSFELANLLRGDATSALVRVAAAKPTHIDCFALGPELLPPGKGSQGGCLLLMSKSELAEMLPEPDVIEGFQDETNCEYVTGWAWSPGRPDERLRVELLAAGEPVEVGTADVRREDLVAAGVGDGIHGFHIATPPVLKDGAEHPLSVRVAGTDRLLPGEHPIRCTP